MTASPPNTTQSSPVENCSISLPNSQTSLKLDLITWLQLVAYHSQSGSIEDQKSLKALTYCIPDFNTAPAEIRSVLQKIQEIASKGQWDKTLSPNSSKVLHQLMRQLSPNSQRIPTNSPITRKLNFSTDSLDDGN